MMMFGQKLLLQCPCSGGPANILVLLAMVAGIWLLAGWIKQVLKKKGESFMNKIAKIVIVVVLIAVLAIVIAVKQYSSSSQAVARKAVKISANESVEQELTGYRPEQITGKGLPALIDIGAGTCIPCKLMAPILEGLKKEYAGVFNVEFIDVWKNPDAAQQYSIRVIPTQIFFDASGKELFRHEGFFSKEDILAKWKQFGVELRKSQ